ncbi:sporulation protein [Shimazuella kribbensis]|uniref:sporulation protein n=1 Tax=Shimazuella kribbensis TaxID=139808 RepID=UPI00040DC532|nr:sporulation protein [Shimazuella kribbensis]
MFKKMMAKLGKGSAKIDLILYETKVPLGGQVKGELVLEGGTVEQVINKIEVELYFELKTKDNKSITHLIAVIPYQASFLIQPGQQKIVSFELPIPEDLLVSSPTASYYLSTNLDIQGGIDATDRDEIIVTPSFDLMQTLLAFEQLGFREEPTSRLFNGVTQEFIFTPTTFLVGKLERMSFIVALDPNQIRLLIDLEIHSFFGKKDKQHEIILPFLMIEDLGKLKSFLHNTLLKLVEGKEPKQDSLKKSSFAGAMGKFVNDLVREFDPRKK